jgi:hypothetical protein
MPLASYNYTLDEAALAAGIPSLGTTVRLLHRLESGLPVTVAVLGASVALNGGCLTQYGRRCMENNGMRPTRVSHGTP